MMNKEQKKQYINDMTSQFDKTEAVIVTHYQGLTVTQLDDLRKKCVFMVLNLKLQIIELLNLL